MSALPRTRPPLISAGVVADAAAVLALVLFAVLAIALHDSVSGLADMATGIRDTGTAIQASGQSTADQLSTSIDRAADTVESVPLLGGQVGGAVRDTGRTSADAVRRETRIDGARLITAGSQGARDARRTARLLGWLAFLIPAVLLGALWIPRRQAAWRGLRPAGDSSAR